MKNTIKRIELGWIEAEEGIKALCSRKGALFRLDTFRYLIPALLMSVSASLRAQTPGGGDGDNALAGALDEAQDQVFDVLDWAFILIIVSVFLVGATGLVFGLIKVFSGRPGEGVVALIVGVVAIIVVVVLIGLFFSFYEEQRDSLNGA